MEKQYGATERNDTLIKYKKRAMLVFGYGEDAATGEGFNYTHVFDKIPTKSEVLNVIVNHTNLTTDEKILSGFVWNDINVWLSTENQFNFKAAYDVAIQTEGATLPIKFKLGENEGNPNYFVFEDMPTFMDFYTKAITYIMTTLNEGWVEKDSAKDWIATLDLED